MDKKIKFSDKPLTAKIIYASVIAILCIAAIVIGIVSAASKTNDDPTPDDNSSLVPGGDCTGEGDGTTPPDDENPTPETPKEPVFVAPIVGAVVGEHNTEIPVFSVTLGEWRVHTGIDISAEMGASVYASEDGIVSRVYNDPLLGHTVEISHNDEIKTRYSNLAKDSTASLTVGAEVKSGDEIGKVGDTSVSELADEAHLHFELLVNDVKVNPLDYISEESKKASLGIIED